MVADSKGRSLREASTPTLYLPLDQQGDFGSLVLHLRASDDVAGLMATLPNLVGGAGLGLELRSVTTPEEMVSGSIARDRMLAGLTSAFGGIALLLTAVGLYGTMAYAVARRTSEIGIRFALGASRTRIAGLLLAEALLVVGVGLLVGLPAAVAGAHWLGSFLCGVGPLDPVALAGATGLLSAVGLLAGLLSTPWRIASRPMCALRHE
jgi:ABC-type antimicrobial peptide transport system permease subunit